MTELSLNMPLKIQYKMWRFLEAVLLYIMFHFIFKP